MADTGEFFTTNNIPPQSQKRPTVKLETSDWKSFVSTARKVNWNGFKNNLLLQAVDRYNPRPEAASRNYSSVLHSRNTSADVASAAKLPLPPSSRPTPFESRRGSATTTPRDTRPPSPNHPFRSRSNTAQSSARQSAMASASPSIRSAANFSAHTRTSSDAYSISNDDTDSMLAAERAIPVSDNHHAASKILGINLDISRFPPTPTNEPRIPSKPSTETRQLVQESLYASPLDTNLLETQAASARQQFMNQFTFRSASPATPTLTESPTAREPTMNLEQTTFYSSESEDEEEGALSQGSPRHSARSSRTSYGVASPLTEEGNGKFAQDHNRTSVKDIPTLGSPRLGGPENKRQSPVYPQRTPAQPEPRTEAAAGSVGRKVHHKSGPRNFSRPSNSDFKTAAPSQTDRASGPISGEPAKVTKKPIESTKGNVAKIMSGKERRSARPLSLAVMKESESIISADAAETVILHIFESVDDFKDLFCLARINRGFYNIFKIHELTLMKNTLQNISPPAWELREASPKEICVARGYGKAEYTPTLYMQFHTRDTYVLSALKAVIVSRCQQNLRQETIKALRERGTSGAARVNDALWRIWTFCTLFGADQGGEFDLESQMHWLRGGMTARDPGRRSSAASTRASTRKTHSSRSSSSHFFGRGNSHGLTLDELYDMEELWDSIKALLRGLVGPDRVEQARENGVFDDKDLDLDDTRAQAALLEEWYHYLATLGLCTISDLAAHLTSRSSSVFIAAKDMEWTSWTIPQQGRSRKDFLKEAVSRVYDERLAITKVNGEVEADEMRAQRKAKRTSLAVEIKNERKESLGLKEMSANEDVGMSLWVQWINKLETPTMTHTPPTPTAVVPPKHSPVASREIKATKPIRSSGRSPLRSRGASGTLSLIPPEYRNNTPGSSARPTPSATPVITPAASPQRSRASSLRSLDASQSSGAQARHKNSTRPSLLRVGSNPLLNETLYEEPPTPTAIPTATPPPRPATAYATSAATNEGLLSKSEHNELKPRTFAVANGIIRPAHLPPVEKSGPIDFGLLSDSELMQPLYRTSNETERPATAVTVQSTRESTQSPTSPRPRKGSLSNIPRRPRPAEVPLYHARLNDSEPKTRDSALQDRPHAASRARPGEVTLQPVPPTSPRSDVSVRTHKAKPSRTRPAEVTLLAGRVASQTEADALQERPQTASRRRPGEVTLMSGDPNAPLPEGLTVQTHKRVRSRPRPGEVTLHS